MTLFLFIDAVTFLTEATALVASMEDTPLIVNHIYTIVEVILLIVDCLRGQNVTYLALFKLSYLALNIGADKHPSEYSCMNEIICMNKICMIFRS